MSAEESQENGGKVGLAVAQAAVFAMTLAAFFLTLQKSGIYDYFDGVRYLANGISLLHDAKGAPLPLAYAPESLPDAFARQEQLSYPSLIYQFWSAMTAGMQAPSLLWVSMSGCILFAVHNMFFLLLARKFLPLAAATAVTAFLCFNPLDNLLQRVMVRPLPDGFLMVASTLSTYLIVSGRPIVAGVAAAAGSLIRFQGVLILWSNAMLVQRKWPAILFVSVWLGLFVAGSTFINLALAHYIGAHGDQNSGFYTSIFQSQSWITLLERLPSDLRMTFTALFETREYPLYLLATPFILVGMRFGADEFERRFMAFSVVSAHATSFISFHALTVAAGGGQADRYLIYPGPMILLAAVISLRLILKRTGIRRDVITGLIVVSVAATFTLSAWRMRHNVPFWHAIYLPDNKLAAIPADAVIGIAAAEESAYEIYAATKARRLMWLPDIPAAFESRNNRTIDYLLIGGYWDRGADKPWIALAKKHEPISDAAGTQFDFLQSTDYYWVYKRRAVDNLR